jgi:hypothetical protein
MYIYTHTISYLQIRKELEIRGCEIKTSCEVKSVSSFSRGKSYFVVLQKTFIHLFIVVIHILLYYHKGLLKFCSLL